MLNNNMAGSELCFPLPYTFPISKVKEMESNMQQTLTNFRELAIEIERLNSEYKHLKSLYEADKDKKESVPCCNCEALQIEVVSKEQTFDSLVSVIRKLCDTKDLSALQAIKELIKSNIKISKENVQDNANNNFQNISSVINIEDINNESISEIEGTPTGRSSPIIQHKKGKTHLSLKDKKKCPDEWPTPDEKNIKLSFPTPTRTKLSSRLKQSRINLVKIKNTNVVDLTCSPEYMGKSYSEPYNVQCNNKKYALDNDDTILPSPTSEHFNLPMLYKALCNDSTIKLNKLQTATKLNFEEDTNKNIKNKTQTICKDIEDSTHLLQNYTKRLKQHKQETSNETHPNESISLLNTRKTDININTGPNRRPLIENQNVINACDTVSSMTTLRGFAPTSHITESKPVIEPLYKEPAVRKKAEKRALPGWSCDECKDFFDELYKYDPEMLAKKMDECSKHRGRNNPARPKTPDGFWYPRWDVPDDTEEFNRRNNV